LAPSKSPRILSVEDILSSDDLPEQVVETPEWGGAVRIKPFSKAKSVQLREEAGGTELDMGKFEMLLFIHGVIEPQFTVEQLSVLSEKSAHVIDRVLSVIMLASGLTEEARQKAKGTFPTG